MRVAGVELIAAYEAQAAAAAAAEVARRALARAHEPLTPPAPLDGTGAAPTPSAHVAAPPQSAGLAAVGGGRKRSRATYDPPPPYDDEEALAQERARLQRLQECSLTQAE